MSDFDPRCGVADPDTDVAAVLKGFPGTDNGISRHFLQAPQIQFPFVNIGPAVTPAADVDFRSGSVKSLTNLQVDGTPVAERKRVWQIQTVG